MKEMQRTHGRTAAMRKPDDGAETTVVKEMQRARNWPS